MTKKLRILFIESPQSWVVRPNQQIPIGLLLLATIVQNEGYDVKFIRPKYKEELLKYNNYDVFCLSGTTLEHKMNEEVAKLIRENIPNAKIIIGGTHVTAMSQEVKESKIFDSICVTEGEHTILKMLKDIEENNLKPIYYMENYIKDLNKIPLINYDLVDGLLGGHEIFFGRTAYKEGGSVNMTTSRGCPFNCHFCSSKNMWTRKVRYRSVENIIKDIKIIKEKYNIHQIRFADDNWSSDRKRCKELCEALIPLNIIWRCSIRADSITKELAELMYKSGCREVSPGIETFDQELVDNLNKGTKIYKVINGIKNASNAGLDVRCLLMTGVPFETMKAVKETERVLIDLKDYIKGITLSTFIPLPGTPFFQFPEKFHIKILTKDWAKYNKDYYQYKGGNIRKYDPLIRNLLLTEQEQREIVEEMDKVMTRFNEKVNKG